MSNWQKREAKRLGLNRAIEQADENARKWRALREENMKRTEAAS